MTTPKFIMDLLKIEIDRIQIDLLQKVATKYNLEVKELISEFVPGELSIVPNTDVTITVAKKIPSKNQPPKDVRCMARVWNRGKGGQCTRCRLVESEYCSQHTVNLKHGRIDNKVPREIFPKKSKSIYK